MPDDLDALFATATLPPPRRAVPLPGPQPAGDDIDALFATAPIAGGAPPQPAPPVEPPMEEPSMPNGLLDALGLTNTVDRIGSGFAAGREGLLRGFMGAGNAVGLVPNAAVAEQTADAQRAADVADATGIGHIAHTAADLAPWLVPGGQAVGAVNSFGNRRQDVVDAGGSQTKGALAGLIDGAMAVLVPKVVHATLGTAASKAGAAVAARLSPTAGQIAEHAITGGATGGGLSTSSAAVSAGTGDYQRAKGELRAIPEQIGVGAGLGAGGALLSRLWQGAGAPIAHGDEEGSPPAGATEMAPGVGSTASGYNAQRLAELGIDPAHVAALFEGGPAGGGIAEHQITPEDAAAQVAALFREHEAGAGTIQPAKHEAPSGQASPTNPAPNEPAVPAPNMEANHGQDEAQGQIGEGGQAASPQAEADAASLLSPALDAGAAVQVRAGRQFLDGEVLSRNADGKINVRLADGRTLKAVPAFRVVPAKGPDAGRAGRAAEGTGETSMAAGEPRAAVPSGEQVPEANAQRPEVAPPVGARGVATEQGPVAGAVGRRAGQRTPASEGMSLLNVESLRNRAAAAKRGELDQPKPPAEDETRLDRPAVQRAPMTRESLHGALTEATKGRVKPEEIDATLAIVDARAKAMGLSPDEFVAQRVAGVERGPAPADALDQAAYHGSPHVFDRFTTKKIGTGEGEQLYGHGLYFSGKKEIAEHYRNKLAPTTFTFDRKPLTPESARAKAKGVPEFMPAIESAIRQSNTIDGAQAFLDEAAKRSASWKPVATFLRKHRGRFGVESKGKLYTAEIPDPGTYLIDDQPVSKQSPIVREAAAKLHNELPAAGADSPTITGHELYDNLVYHFQSGGMNHRDAQRAASSALASLGIRGIDYPAGAMSGADDGKTRNYVVFRDDDVAITSMEQRGAAGQVNGAVRFLDDGRAIIHVLESADASTVLHELAHIFRRDLAGADLGAIEEWAGVRDGQWTRGAEEKFARGFERYVADGVAPTRALAGVFKKFANWLSGVYGAIKGSPIDVQVSDAARAVFDRLLGGRDRTRAKGESRFMPAEDDPALKNQQSATFEPPAEPDGISDFGEKIGGARKDLSEKGVARPKVTKPKDERPAWARRYEIGEIASSSKPDEKGKFAIRDTKDTDWSGQSRQKGPLFATREEAEAAIPLLAVLRNHKVRQERATEKWAIVRDVTDRKRVTIKGGFATEEDANRYLAMHARDVIETETGYGEEVLAKPDSIKRVGPQRRTGDVGPKDFTEAFGFRGVEFGNWNNQAERSEVMNHAYDAMLDLAEVVGVPPRALSLNGELALAFGARGHGLQGARAHYEHDHAVINLTKMKGAGSLAHEWWHALDHYLGRLDGKASSERVDVAGGGKVFKAKGASADMVSHGFRYNSKARPELIEAHKRLSETIHRKAERFVEDTQQAERFVSKQRDEVDAMLRQVRAHIAKAREWGKKKGPASPEQLARFDAAADRLLNGDDRGVKLGEDFRRSNESIDQISAVLKEVTGRQGRNAEHTGDLDRLAMQVGHYAARMKMLEDARAATPKEKMIPTQFVRDAKEIDQGRASDYWTTEHELMARAFSAYVEDKLTARKGSSDFLSFGSDNWRYVLNGIRPFPEGEERLSIGKAFDQFLGTLKHEKTAEGNTRLFAPEREPGADEPTASGEDAGDRQFAPERPLDEEAGAAAPIRPLDEPSPKDAKGPVGHTEQGRPFSRKPLPATAARVPVEAIAPEPGSEHLPVKRLKGVIGDLGRALSDAGAGNPGLYGPAAVPTGHGGVYDPATGLTGIGYHGDLDATAHEIGHRLDHRYAYSKLSGEGVAKELGYFARWGSGVPEDIQGADAREAYRRREGMAEFIRARIVNPDEAERLAPALNKIFESQTPAKVRKVLDAFSAEVRRFEGLSPEQRTEANLVATIDVVRNEKNPLRKAVGFFGSLMRTQKSGGSKVEIPVWHGSVKDRLAFLWTNVMHPAYGKWLEAWKRNGVIDPETLKPSDNWRILQRTLAGEQAKVREMVFGAGMTDAFNRPVYDHETGARMTLDWLLEPFSGMAPEKASREMDRAMAKGIEQRVVGEGDKRFERAAQDVKDLWSQALGLTEESGQREAAAAPEVERIVADYRKAVDTDAAASMRLKGKLLKMATDGKKRTSREREEALAPEITKFAEARRALARREVSRLAGIGGGLHNDYLQAQAALSGRANDPSAGIHDEFLRRYRGWANHLIRYAAEAGALSGEQAERILKSGKWTDNDGVERDIYIDMHRVFDDEEVPSLPTKRFRGSTRLVANPLENLLWSTLSTVSWADRNRVRAAFVKPLRGEGRTAESPQEDLHEIGYRVDEARLQELRKEGAQKVDGRKVYTVRNDGEVEHWVFDPAVEASFEAARAQSGDNLYIQVSDAINRVRKAGITLSPSFLLRQPFRDTVDRLFNTETGSGLKDMLDGYRAAETEDGKRALGEMYNLSGAGFAGYQEGKSLLGKELATHLQKLVQKHGAILATPHQLGEGLRWLQEESDRLNRRAEWASAFKQAKGKGWGDYDSMLYAADKARGLIDFAERGRYGAHVNRIALFFNPSVQGLRRFARTWTVNPKRAVAGVLPSLLVSGVGMRLLMEALMSDDDREEWRQQPQYVRDFHWLFNLGGTKIAVPKPYEYGYVMSGAERLADWTIAHAKGDKDAASRAFEGYGKSFAGALIPMDEQVMAAAFFPVVESMLNYSAFKQRHIVPPYEENLALDLRKGTAEASKLGRMLQGAMGIDARKIDHVVEGYLGGYGRLATAAGKPADWWAGAVSGLVKSSPSWSARDVVWLRDFAGEEGQGQKPYMKGLMARLKASVEAPTLEGRTAAAKDARELASRIRARIEANPKAYQHRRPAPAMEE